MTYEWTKSESIQKKKKKKDKTQNKTKANSLGKTIKWVT